MANSTEEITELSREHKLFILEEKDLVPNILGFHRVQVLAGNKWLVYCNGKLVEQFDAGPHTWWNGFMHNWKAQIINTRIETLRKTIKGRVRGPSGPKEIPGAHMMELACEVTAQLQLSVRIVDVENFIQYSDPLSEFDASIRNIVVELIGQLKYDHYGQWATELRTLILDRLQGRSQGGVDDSESRLGIRAEKVYVTSFQPSTANDRNMLQMYQLVERVRRELLEVQANAQRDSIAARSYAEQGDILKIAPSLLALQDSPLGKALLARDAELRGLMVQAGFNPGVNITMQQPTGPRSLAAPMAVGYLPPVQPTTPQATLSGSLAGREITGEIFSMPVDASGPLPVPPSIGDEPPVDATRQRAEIEALTQGGFAPAGSGKVSPRYDEQGQPIAGSKEWVLQVAQPRSGSYLTIAFYCPMGYPAQSPRVQMRSPAGGGWTWVEPNSVKNWNPGRRLLEVAQEIAMSLPPS